MNGHDGTAPAPPSWEATQRWLDELDQDATTPGPPAEPDHDADPTDLDVVDDSADQAVPPDVADITEHSTVILDDTSRFGRDYAPEQPADTDDADGDHPVPTYYDEPDDTDLYDTEPTDLDGAPTLATDVLDAHHGSADTERLGGGDNAEPPRFNKAVAGGFVAATVVATIVTTATLLSMRSSPQPEPDQSSSSTQISVAPAPTPPPALDAGADTPIPYTASAPGCPPGSTAAQAVAGTDPTQAWVCVRNGVDGQVLHLDLGRPMVVTANCITPGWVGADATGADQWLEHRVLTRVQWNLFNGSDTPTVVPQNTGNVRGEACQPMPNNGVLASRITMIVQETSRAPADTAPSTTAAPGGGGGLLDDVLGAPLGPPPSPSTDPGAALLPGLPGEQTPNDPADNTFAVSSIKILGHPPR